MQEQYTACPITKSDYYKLIREVKTQIINEAVNEGRAWTLKGAYAEAKFLVDDLYVVVEEVK